MAAEFTLRELRPADNAALAALMTEEGDNPGFGLTTHYQIDPYRALLAQHDQTIGVVAEVDGFDGLAGVATVSFDELQFEDRLLPSAYLANLKVHHQFRRRGLGGMLAQWRIDRARQAFGDDGVIWTRMQRENGGSRGTARKWSREFLEPFNLTIMPNRTRPPKAPNSLVVRQAEMDDLDEVSSRLNQFYQAYNLFKPQTSESLAEWLAQTPVDRPIHHYFVAVGAHGNIVAGAGVTAMQHVMIERVNNPPLPLRTLNPIFNLFPRDYIIRTLPVSDLWHLPDQLAAAQFLWQSLRWQCREMGTTLMIPYDLRGPLAPIFQLKPWHQPRVELAVALHGPIPTSYGRLIYMSSR